MNTAADQAAIGECITRCRMSRDERGRWRAERRCAEALKQPMAGDDWIARAQAAAARRIGAWLASVRLA